MERREVLEAAKKIKSYCKNKSTITAFSMA